MKATSLRVLVVIVNYGVKNDEFLKRLLEEYALMPWQVHIVVLSNVQKELKPNVEFVLKTPPTDPRAFPFLHRELLARRVNDYDLFIYTEDDTLLTTRNIEAYLKVSQFLRDDEIAGFIRSETDGQGERYCSTLHGPHHWIPSSVVQRGGLTFAQITNHHSACYVATRAQLDRAIRSGGFLVSPHKGRYDLLETAATDIYTQCGFRKLICVSQLEDFVLPHLPNVYIGILGAPMADCHRQVETLVAIGEGRHPRTVLAPAETSLRHLRWSKNYYEPARDDIVKLLPKGPAAVLSFGCGWGAIEGELVSRGLNVSAVPMDSVIASCVKARGVTRIIYGDIDAVLDQLTASSFDCVVLNNLLHLVQEPRSLLESLVARLRDGGTVIMSIPNLARLPLLWRTRHDRLWSANDFRNAGLQPVSLGTAKRWCARAQLAIDRIQPVYTGRATTMPAVARTIASNVLATEWLIRLRKA